MNYELPSIITEFVVQVSHLMDNNGNNGAGKSHCFNFIICPKEITSPCPFRNTFLLSLLDADAFTTQDRNERETCKRVVPRGGSLRLLMRPKMNWLCTSVKGHLLNRFHVGSSSTDLRSEVITDTNVNKTHCQLKHLRQLCCSKLFFVTQPLVEADGFRNGTERCMTDLHSHKCLHGLLMDERHLC